MWVGTLFGLNLFDPKSKTFRRYNIPQPGGILQKGSQKNALRAIAEMDSGQLVLGTSVGIQFFNTKSKTLVDRTEKAVVLNSNSVLSVISDLQEDLWIGTANGLTYVEGRSGALTLYQHDSNTNSLSDNYVNCVYTDSRGRLWVGTVNGLNLFDRKTKSFEKFYHEPNRPSSLSNNYVNAIGEDIQGRLWVGTRHGLNLYDPEKNAFTVYQNQPGDDHSISDNYITSITRDASGHLIIGTYGNGFNVLDGRDKPFTTYSHNPEDPSSLSGNIVWSLFRDSKRRLWVGTSSGLNLLNEKTGHFENHWHQTLQPHWFPDNEIMTIAEDKYGLLWLGTARNGLMILDLTAKTVEHYLHDPNQPSSLASNHVACIERDKAGNMWVGTFGALSLFDFESKTFTHFRNELRDSIAHPTKVNFIHENSQGQLWVGLHTGAALFDPLTKTFTNYAHKPNDTTAVSSSFVMHITKDSHQRMWFATDHGLNILNPKTQTFNTLHYGGREYPGDYFYEVLEDSKGRLWSGTNGGLICFTPAPDFAPEEGRWGKIKNYTQRDGIQHNEFNVGAYFKDQDGTFFLGGINGFTEFRPDSIKEDSFVAPVMVTGLEIFNKPIQPGKNYDGFTLPASITELDTLKLSYHESIFTLEFAALTYARAKEFKYAYRLKNFEEAWNYVDANRRFATYTNLDPGTYVFLIKAANTDGVWSEHESSLTIVITPPWWGTWWFRSILGLSALSGVALLLYYRTRRISEANTELTRLVDQKTTELTEKNEELMVQTSLLEQKNHELERAKGQLEFEMQYQHQRQLLKLSIDVQEKERQRIAKDLHDELGAVLSIARMHLVHMEGQHPGEVTLEGLQQARTLTENALGTMRRISHELMPLQLQKYGLIKTLEALTSQVNGTNKIHIELVCPDYEPDWSKATELGLYRVLMEMINNTLKHSTADRVQIVLNQSLEHIVVTYIDNGTGLGENHNKGLGLQNIDARVNALGGTFEIIKGTIGFHARIIIPL